MDFYSNKDLNVKMCRDICIVLFCWYALLRYDDVSQLKVDDFKIDNDVFDLLFCFFKLLHQLAYILTLQHCHLGYQ